MRRQSWTRRELAKLALAVTMLVGCDPGVRPDPDRVDPELALPQKGTVPLDLRIGVTPHSGQDTASLSQPLFDYLERKLEQPVKGVTAKDYDSLAELVTTGRVDVGIFSPLSYVKEKDSMRAVAIATATQHDSPTYVGYIVTVGQWPPPTLESLKGKRIAYVHKSSSSGWLYPRALLRERGIDPDNFFAKPPVFAKDHKEALRLLAVGDVEVAAVSGPFVDPGTLNPLIDDVERESLQVVAKTDRIPFDCVVVRDDIQRDLGERLQKALFDFVHAPEAAQLQKKWGMNGFVRPEGRYDDLARLYEAERDKK